MSLRIARMPKEPIRSALMVSIVEPSDVATTLRYYLNVFPEEAAEMLVGK